MSYLKWRPVKAESSHLDRAVGGRHLSRHRLPLTVGGAALCTEVEERRRLLGGTDDEPDVQRRRGLVPRPDPVAEGDAGAGGELKRRGGDQPAVDVLGCGGFLPGEVGEVDAGRLRGKVGDLHTEVGGAENLPVARLVERVARPEGAGGARFKVLAVVGGSGGDGYRQKSQSQSSHGGSHGWSQEGVTTDSRRIAAESGGLAGHEATGRAPGED